MALRPFFVLSSYLSLLLLLVPPAQCISGRTVLFSYSPGAKQKFNPLSNPYFEYRFVDSAQAQAQVRYSTSTRGLTCAATPFTRTENQTGGAGTLDHVKFLILHKKTFAPTAKKKVLRLTLFHSTNVSGTTAHPFPPGYVTRPDDDPRLGSCSLYSGDLSNGIVAQFLVTNKGIYAYYERLPSNRTASNSYRAFAQVKRVLNTSPTHTFPLTVEYDSQKGWLSWMINWKTVLRVTKIGVPSADRSVITISDLGGTETVVQPASFSFGWGCSTLLDATDYWNVSSAAGLVKLNPEGYVKPSSFYDVSSKPSNRLWGQGSTITVKKYVVAVGHQCNCP